MAYIVRFARDGQQTVHVDSARAALAAADAAVAEGAADVTITDATGDALSPDQFREQAAGVAQVGFPRPD